jgi:tRNA threonylcarbamoyladenosine biosynthesis protein TsaE
MPDLETICGTPDETFARGERLGASLSGGELILLYGGLGAGKTLFTKGILNGIGYDIDEVTSPSFTLVNLYKTADLDVYHIDLWRRDGPGDAARAVGLDEILDQPRSVTIIEWADRLGDVSFSNKTIAVNIEGDGDEPRVISIKY